MGKTRKLKGGKYKYEGTYGCTYFPAMKCKGDLARSPFMISKIMRASSAEDEYSKRNMLKKIDPDQKFFLWPRRICEVKRRDLTAEDDLGPCTLVGYQIRRNLTNAKLIYYTDGGVDLEHVELNPNQYQEFFIGLGQLLEGLTLLHSRDAVHLDIKPANIVVAPLANGKFDFHFIDFGFTCKTRNYDRQKVPNVNYSIWPYEYRFAKYTFKKADITDEDTEEFIESIEDYEYLPSSILNVGENKQQENYDLYQGLGETRGDKLTHLLKAVDVYSLGVAFARVYYSLIGHFIKGPHPYNIDAVAEIQAASPNVMLANLFLMRKVSRPFLEFVAKLIHPNLAMRLTAREAYEQFQALIPAFTHFKPSLVSEAFSTLDRPPVPILPPTPVSPGLGQIQTNLFGGGKKKKTQRKRR